MALIGAILGDISGSQYEFSRMRPIDLDWQNVPLFTDKCRFTDDTILSVATKDAILKNPKNPDFFNAYYEFGNKYKSGYGPKFKEWLQSPKPQPYGSFGNGSAMRCSFIGEYYDDINDVVEQAKRSAMVTHNHPEGVKGACVTAVCVWAAKHGKTKVEIFDYIKRFYSNIDKYKYPISLDLSEMRDIYKWDVTCQGSVAPAMRCFLESDNWEGFMRNVMSLPCDMDTLGAIGGGVAEEFFKGTGQANLKILERYLPDELLDIALKGD